MINKDKIKHTKNIYFYFKEEGTTLKYHLIVNAEDKKAIYDKEKEGYCVVKVLANE